MTIDDAKNLIRAGVKFGDVYPALQTTTPKLSDLDDLKEWFVSDPTLPTNRAVPHRDLIPSQTFDVLMPEKPTNDHHKKTDDRTALIRTARQQGFSGDECKKCGSMQMVWSGSCQKCCNCGEQGGCA